MIEIKEMSENDIEEIAEAEKSCFSIPWSANAFYDELENELAVYYVARIDGKFVGYAGFWEVSGEGDITNIAVIPEYRLHGIGSLLMERIILRAEDDGLFSLTLEVRRTNFSAQKLYGKYGFETVGCRKAYYSDNGEDAFVMMRSIK